MKKEKTGFLAAVVLLFFITIPAMAGQNEQFTDEQEIGAKHSSAEQARRDIKLETIMVTAQKTEENLQDVPISTTVFDEFSIQDKMIDEISDIAKYTPGLEIIGLGAAVKSTPSIRGIYSDYVTRSSSAGLFVDGVPVTDGSGFDQTLLNIERVEVLKGPQGTLYGKNTEVGAVNIITKKPTNETRGKIRINIGEDSKRELAFNVSGAIVKDEFYIGVSGKHYEKDGIIKNTRTDETADDRVHNYGKINLRWTPTEDLELSLITSKIEYDDEANRGNRTQNNAKETSSDFDEYNRSEILLNALSVSYNVNSNMSLSSITAYRKYDEIQQNDWDSSDDDTQKFHATNDSLFETLSEEVKLNYKNQNIKLVSGVFLEKSDMHIDKDRDAAWGFKTLIRDYEARSIGLFSHLTYDMTEKLSVLGGLRFDWETSEYEDSSETIDRDDNELCPKIGLTYSFQDDLMLYTTASKGYRSGGVNSLVPDGYSKTFDKESLYSYEAGVKGLAFNSKLKYDVALYYMDITDMQVNYYIDLANVIKKNAAEATSKGIEASLQLKATDALSFFAGFSYNDITFDKYYDGQEDYSGKRTPYSPKYDFNLGFLYRAINGFYASADISGYGDMYLGESNEYKRDAFELVNAKIGYETNNYDIYLYAKNIFDKEYNRIDVDYTAYSDPREIGLQFVYRF